MLKHKIKNVIAALLTCMIIIGMTVSATETAPVFIDESLMAELEEHVARQNASLSKSEIKTLAQELYQEKYIDEPSVSSAEEQADFVDIAYENMLKRENYIVELISSHSGEPTSRDAWEFNLTYLKQHYDEITTLDNINLQYIDSYIEDYEILLHTQDMPESRINIAYRGSYSVTKAVEYAEKYYQNYNSAIQIGANHTVVTAQTLFLNAYMQSELRNGYTKTYSDSDGSAFYIAGGSTVTFTVKLQSSSHVVMGYKDSNGKQYQTYNDTNKTNTTSISIPNTGFYRFYLTNVSDSTIKITGGSITF